MTSAMDAFERGTIDAATFDHREHVRTAWSYLEHLPFAEAALRFTSALRRFAAANGKPELYHETITWAFLTIVHDRRSRAVEPGWDAFETANADLFRWKPSVLDQLYTAETLWSEHARRVFVLPDLRTSA